MPTGHYPRTAAHSAAIAAGQKRRIAAMSPEDRARHVQRLELARQSPNWHPQDSQVNAEAKRRWWASLSTEKRESFLAKRGAGIRRFYAGKSPEWKRQRFDKAIQAGAAATKAMWAALSPSEKAEKLQPTWKGAAAKGYQWTPEHLAAIRAGRRKYLAVAWAGLNYEDRLRQTAPGRRAARLGNRSKLEIIVSTMLDALAIAYIPEFAIGPYVADFYIPDQQLIIECDGTYWHGLPGCVEKDAIRDAWMQSRGFTVIRLPEPDIRSGAVRNVLSRLAV